LHDADQIAFGVREVDQPADPGDREARDEQVAPCSAGGGCGGVEVGDVDGGDDELAGLNSVVGADGVGAVDAEPGIVTGGDDPAVPAVIG
jgi:hypothetical protein